MKKPVYLGDEAKAELSIAGEWYEAHRTGLAQVFLGTVREVLSLLEESTRVGTPIRGVDPGLGVRRVLLRKFPYSVVFVEMANEIRVLAFAHTRRRPGYWMERLEKQSG
jgi:hypothetical protein